MGWNPFDAIGDIFEEVVSWFVDIPEPERGIEINRSSRNDPIPVTYGRDKVKGANWAYWSTSGTNKRYLYIWAAFGEGEIDGFEEIFIDDKTLAEFNRVNRSSYPNFAPYVGDDIVVIREYFGTDDQTSDAMLQAVDPRWTVDHRLRGTAGLVCRFRWNDRFFTSLPQIAAVVRGRKVLNAAGTADEWTENAALILRDYLTNTRYGKGLDWSVDFDQTSWQAAFTDCEETETYFQNEGLGAPTEIVLGAASGEEYMRWDERPTNAIAHAGADLVGGTSGATARARTGYMSNGWYGADGGYYLPFDTINGSFQGGENVVASQTNGKLFSFNGTLNAGQEFDTILDNVKRLRAVMRGVMPQIQGKFHLYVEKGRAAVTTIKESEIIGGIEWSASKKGDRRNQVTVKFVNPSAEWKEDVAVWPDPGSPEEIQFLADDNGQFLPLELSIEGIRNAYQAKDIARIICLKSRDNIQASLTCEPRLLGYHCGQVVGLDWAGNGWSDKPFLITQRGLSEDGNAIFGLEEHTAGIYPYEADVLDVIRDNTDLPDPFAVPVPSGVTTVTVGDFLEDKRPRQVNLYIDMEWDTVDDEQVRDYEVRVRKIEMYYQGGWVPDVGPWTVHPKIAQVPEAEPRVEYLLQVFEWLKAYEVEVRCINDAGVVGDWSATTRHELLLDTTPPGIPAIVSVWTGETSATVNFTPPTDIDYSHAQIFVNTTDVVPATPVIEKAPGEQAIVTGLSPGQDYYYWTKGVDDVGNVSAASSSYFAPTSQNFTSYYKSSAPVNGVDGTFRDGDLWYHTGQANNQYRWSGTVWVDVQDGAIGDAQQTATSAQITADNALSAAADALYDANNILRGQVIAGEIVAEHWLTAATTQYNNPANGVGNNDNIGFLTFTARGSNIVAEANANMLVSQYQNGGDLTDIPFARGGLMMRNNTTGSTTEYIGNANFVACTLREPPAGGASEFEGVLTCTGSTDFVSAPSVSQGHSIRVSLRGVYYRGVSTTQADACIWLTPTVHVSEFNNI